MADEIKAGGSNIDQKVDQYMDAAVGSVLVGDGEVQKALDMIDEQAAHTADSRPLQLLALRRYVHYDEQDTLMSQWVWSSARRIEYLRSKEYQAVQEEIRKVDTFFRRANPGCWLATSPIRDLAKQVHRWDNNTSVQKAALNLMQQAQRELKKAHYPERPNTLGVAMFRHFLRTVIVHPEPTNAAPGTSDHGQMHAIDFVVFKDGRAVASTDTADIAKAWDETGWTAKLKAAVDGSKSKFVGPLRTPREPWHYTIGKGSAKIGGQQQLGPLGDWPSSGRLSG